MPPDLIESLAALLLVPLHGHQPDLKASCFQKLERQWELVMQWVNDDTESLAAAGRLHERPPTVPFLARTDELTQCPGGSLMAILTKN
jgi:hypothetical protein